MATQPTAGVPSSPATATVIFNSALPGTDYRLKKQMIVELMQDEAGRFVVCEPTTGVFHDDVTWPAALEGFIETFVNQFETLQRKENDLSTALAAELDRFRYLLIPHS